MRQVNQVCPSRPEPPTWAVIWLASPLPPSLKSKPMDSRPDPTMMAATLLRAIREKRGAQSR